MPIFKPDALFKPQKAIERGGAGVESLKTLSMPLFLSDFFENGGIDNIYCKVLQ